MRTRSTGNRACIPKALPVRCWQARQWHIEIRTGSPSTVTVSCPQLQAARRSAIRGHATSTPCRDAELAPHSGFVEDLPGLGDLPAGDPEDDHLVDEAELPGRLDADDGAPVSAAVGHVR